MINDIMDLHTHTIVSGHAYNTLYEMARAAADHGMKVLGSTDHAPPEVSRVPAMKSTLRILKSSQSIYLGCGC